MKRIKITNTNQLIKFIKETDLSFDNYLKICRVFTRSSLFWFVNNENKEDIIQFLKSYKDWINKNLEVPEYVDKNIIENPKIGERYFYSNYYPNS